MLLAARDDLRPPATNEKKASQSRKYPVQFGYNTENSEGY